METPLIYLGLFYIFVLFGLTINYPVVWISIIPLGLIFGDDSPLDKTFFGLVKYGIVFHLYLFVGVNLQNFIKKHKILNDVDNFLSGSSEPKPVKQEPETEEEKLQREKLEKSRREKINRIEEQEKRRRKRKEKKLEELRKKKEFWFKLDGFETEDELNKVFDKLGFKSKLTSYSNDEGIDHVLDGNIVVQTKNQKKKVSRPDLQRFWGSWKDSHKKGIFVSIHGFTNTCEEFVKDKPILLYDVDDVVRMSEGKKPKWND